MSCVIETSEDSDSIEMQFEMLSRVAPQNILNGDVDACTGPSTFGLSESGQFKGIAKHRILLVM